MPDHCKVTSDLGKVCVRRFPAWFKVAVQALSQHVQAQMMASCSQWCQSQSESVVLQTSKPAACRLFDQYVKSAIESSVADQATILVPVQASLLPLHAFVSTEGPAHDW